MMSHHTTRSTFIVQLRSQPIHISLIDVVSCKMLEAIQHLLGLTREEASKELIINVFSPHKPHELVDQLVDHR